MFLINVVKLILQRSTTGAEARKGVPNCTPTNIPPFLHRTIGVGGFNGYYVLTTAVSPCGSYERARGDLFLEKAFDDFGNSVHIPSCFELLLLSVALISVICL